MSIIVITVIDCPIETVFEAYMRPEFREEWDDNVVKGYYENPDESIAVGTIFHVVVTAMGRERDTIRAIVEYEPPYKMTYESLVTGVRIRSCQTFEEQGNKTKMTMNATMEADGFLSLLAWIVTMQMRGHMKEGLMSFKRLMEERCS